MLDFSRLKAPVGHGEVLVVPEPIACAQAAAENRKRMDGCRASIAGMELRELRRRTRVRLGVDDGRLVIVTGHQPEFMHAGVWAKHVVAKRLASAVGGTALNLVVDSDAPASTDLLIPDLDGREGLRRIKSAVLRAGLPYERLGSMTGVEVERFEREVRAAMGVRFGPSLMPRYLDSLRQASGAEAWVEQTLAGRHAAEESLGVAVRDLRVSDAWWSPVLAELLTNGPRFAAAYNESLAEYRREHRVRGENRPIPDLQVSDERTEIPVWAFRNNEPRSRVFVQYRDDAARIVAAERIIAELSRREIATQDDLIAYVEERAEWHLRPRALALTMWARLLLADLFIHGIGGAKYDRITDKIIHRYFGIAPPGMACVTATMRLSDTAGDSSAETVAREKRALRDIAWNPHRGGDRSPAFTELARQREAAAAEAVSLREHRPDDHHARREVFRLIHNLNKRLLELRRGDADRIQSRLHEAQARLARSQITGSREYFFALFTRTELERLLAALPAEQDFRV